MEFNFSYAPGTSLEQMIGIEIAGKIWSSYLADDVAVNIHIETTDDLPEDVIGGTLPGIQANQSYENWKDKLSKDKTSTDDALVLKNLKGDDDEFAALANGKIFNENERLNMTRANAKALGMRRGDDAVLDGVVLLNRLSGQVNGWNYDFSDHVVPGNTLDLLSVGLHEIGHVLGFVSGVDEPELLRNVSGDDDDGDDDDDGGALQYVNPLDMLRYNSKSAALGLIDLSIGGTPFFSIDGGKTALGYFSAGEDITQGGDGYQASHWKQQNDPAGIMDPLLRTGERRTISTLDTRSMDAIGWDLKSGQVDLSVLQQLVKKELADRIGVTVEWLETNPTEAAQRLSQDRTADVEAMIKQSQIYNWRSSSGTRWWQKAGLWQKVDWSTGGAESGAVQVGGSASDYLKGNGERDTLISRAGRDVLAGAGGRDELLGGMGRDVLRGESGEDTLVGGLGKDILIGGADRDHFTYQSLQERGDRIKDFNLSQDVLDLSQMYDEFDQSNPDLLEQTLRLKQVGSDTVVQIKQTSGVDYNVDSNNFKSLVTLENVVAADLAQVASQVIIL